MDERRVRQRGRVVGAYSIPLYPNLVAVEVWVPDRADFVDAGHFAPYRPLYWLDDLEIGLPDFYLSPDGEERIGGCEEGFPDRATHEDEACRRLLSRDAAVTRIVLMMPETRCPEAFYTPWGRLRVPKRQPIPERLLRLIWVDEGWVDTGAGPVDWSFLDEIEDVNEEN